MRFDKIEEEEIIRKLLSQAKSGGEVIGKIDSYGLGEENQI